MTPLGEQRAVAVLPAAHPHAVTSAIALEPLAPDRLVVLSREPNPAFRNAMVAMCHSAGLSPVFVEMPEPRVEHVLLAVAAGAGLALLPETVTERFAASGIRFVALEASEAAFRTAVLTHPDCGQPRGTRLPERARPNRGRPRCPQPSSGRRAGRMTSWAS